MSVSPVDPSNKQTPLRLLDRLHQLELCAYSSDQVSEQLSELRCQQLATVDAVVATLPGNVAERLRANLGAPSALQESELDRLRADAETLSATFDQLSANYEPALMEMAAQGYTALQNSARYTGRERLEELKDSRRLLHGVLEHPIGSRNFAVWFELGWVQWNLGIPLSEVEESFYQASRLSTSAKDLYHVHALRHLAHIQASQGKWQEAVSTMGRVLSTLPENDPILWIEAARYQLQQGNTREAQSLVERALDHQPELAFALFAEPDLAPLYASFVEMVERFAQQARQTASIELNRLQVARTAGTYLGEVFGLQVELPDVLALPLDAERASLFEAQTLAHEARRESTRLFSAAITMMEKEQHDAQESARRLKTQMDQAISEKTYYEGSIRNVESHARESGFSLHPYNFSNPFLRRRNQKAEEARFAYESFKQKLAQAETYLRDHLPAIESALEKQETRAHKAEEAQNWLRAQLL